MPPEQYVKAILAGERSVQSRFITLLESQLEEDRRLAQRVLTALLPHTGRSIRVGITGVPGAGKSTLIEALGMALVGQGHRVAVLAIDPTSRISGGSILGDETRMPDLIRQANVFIRPSPSGLTLGGVARNTREVMLTCEAAGFDVVLIETVGVGQSETVVADMVDFFLVLLIAGAGDELQGIKRGLMEMADLVAINKADGDNRLFAEQACALYQSAMRLMHPPDSPWTPPVLTCSAVENRGIDALWAQVLKHRALFEQTGWFAQRRRNEMVQWMWDLVNESSPRLLHDTPEVRQVAARAEAEVRSGVMTAGDGAERVLRALGLAVTEND
ncbi:MAG: methylmalonyl Co-A mutase-associated GTPase MeaB [Acidimicrobiia bacterium]|nr:methylmalonyl Co-A mutase-associated GTPase MeaB [Acidimicrobiia bacterium]